MYNNFNTLVGFKFFFVARANVSGSHSGRTFTGRIVVAGTVAGRIDVARILWRGDVSHKAPERKLFKWRDGDTNL